jgi:hypothetical protein
MIAVLGISNAGRSCGRWPGKGRLPSVRSRRVGRDVPAVHSDVRALHLSGVIDKTPEGKMILPYQVIRLDFTLDTQQAA